MCTTLFMVATRWKLPTCPCTDDWKDKVWCVCEVEYYSAIKKERKSGTRYDVNES